MGMRVMSWGVLQGFRTLGGVQTNSDTPWSPLLVLTVVGSSAHSELQGNLTSGLECVLGVS